VGIRTHSEQALALLLDNRMNFILVKSRRISAHRSFIAIELI
jgi:hypothetical protein